MAGAMACRMRKCISTVAVQYILHHAQNCFSNLYRVMTATCRVNFKLKAYIYCSTFALQYIDTYQHSDETPTECYTLSRMTLVKSLMHWTTKYPCSKSHT